MSLILKKKRFLNNQNKRFDLNFLDKFLNENIFKIEKKLKKFIKNIFLIIDYEEYFFS